MFRSWRKTVRGHEENRLQMARTVLANHERRLRQRLQSEIYRAKDRRRERRRVSASPLRRRDDEIGPMDPRELWHGCAQLRRRRLDRRVGANAQIPRFHHLQPRRCRSRRHVHQRIRSFSRHGHRYGRSALTRRRNELKSTRHGRRSHRRHEPRQFHPRHERKPQKNGRFHHEHSKHHAQTLPRR